MKKETIYQLERDVAMLNSNANSVAYFIHIASWLNRIFCSYCFCFIFWNCLRYQSKYLSDIKFDNLCITPYFEKINFKRVRKFRKRSMLPLSKFEKKNFFYPFQFFISGYQKPFIKINIAIQIGVIFILVFSLAIDYFIFDFLGKNRNNIFETSLLKT